MKYRIRIYEDINGITWFNPQRKNWYSFEWKFCSYHYRTEQEAISHIDEWKAGAIKDKFTRKYRYKKIN